MSGKGEDAAVCALVRWMAAALVAGSLAGCSGKTEHGGGAGAGAPASGDPSPPSSPAGTERPSSSGGAAPPSSQGAETPAPRRHLLLVVELEPAARAARVLSTQAVELPLPRRRGPERPLPWRVEVLSGEGQVLFSAPLADASERRAEFPDPQTGELRGFKTQKRVTAVTLRLPELTDAQHVRLLNVAEGGVELGRFAYPQVSP